MSMTLDPASAMRRFPRTGDAQPGHEGAACGNADGRFGISKVSLDMEGLITAVLWQALGAQAGEGETACETVAPVRTVIAAIRNGRHVVALFPGMPADAPERRFVVIDHGARGATVALDGAPVPGRDVSDLYMLFLEGTGQRAARWPAPGRSASELDAASSPFSGRIGA